jgi:multidrug efflux pump subunit AcrA (membrane-fusion protein)
MQRVRRSCSYSLATAFAAALLSALGLVGCSHHPAADKAKAKAAPELPVVKAAVLTISERPWPAIVKTQGSLVADEVTVVGAKVGGRVAEVRVDLGDLVTTGAPLAVLDQQEFKLQIVLAQAQLTQARAAWRRRAPSKASSRKIRRRSAKPALCGMKSSIASNGLSRWRPAMR